MKSYDEMIRSLRNRANQFDYEGWVDTAIVLKNAADAIETLNKALKLEYLRGVADERIAAMERDGIPLVQIGDKVYYAHEWYQQPECGTVSMLQQKADKSWKFRISHGNSSSVSDHPASDLGRKVFFTYDEAERYLASLKDKTNLL